MELRYQIPTHLEGFIGNIPEPQLNALVTMLFEYAIQHRMIDYPRTEIENSVDEIRRLVGDVKSKQSLENSLILQMLSSMNMQITTLHHMMAGGQMPPAIQGAPVAYPTFMPVYGAPQQVAPTQEYYHGLVTPPTANSKAVVLELTEEDLKQQEGNELGKSEDSTQSAFESDMFK
jgi:hypothetical protein